MGVSHLGTGWPRASKSFVDDLKMARWVWARGAADEPLIPAAALSGGLRWRAGASR